MSTSSYFVRACLMFISEMSGTQGERERERKRKWKTKGRVFFSSSIHSSYDICTFTFSKFNRHTNWFNSVIIALALCHFVSCHFPFCMWPNVISHFTKRQTHTNTPAHKIVIPASCIGMSTKQNLKPHWSSILVKLFVFLQFASILLCSGHHFSPGFTFTWFILF